MSGDIRSIQNRDVNRSRCPHLLFIGERLSGLLRNDPGIVCGGAERQHAMIARELSKQGWRIDILASGDGPDVNWEGGKIEHVRKTGSMLALCWRYFNEIRRSKAPALLTLGATPFLVVYYLSAVLTGKKLIVGIQHDSDVAIKTRIHGWRRRLYLWTMKRIHLLLVQHEVQKNLARRLVKCPAVVIPNYLLFPVSNTHPPLGKSFVWIGTYRTYKRPEIVLELAQALPDISFILICQPTHDGTRDLGSHRKTGFDTLKSRAEELENVIFVPGCSHDGIQEMILRSKALLITSEGEGWPNVLLEAAGFGRAVLAFNDLADGTISSNGIGIVAKTVEDAISAINHTKSEEWQALGGRALNYVRENYSNEQLTDTLVKQLEPFA